LRVLAHIKKLDECFAQFLVRVICDCGARVRSSPLKLAPNWAQLKDAREALAKQRT